jgi:hypothetical protein
MSIIKRTLAFIVAVAAVVAVTQVALGRAAQAHGTGWGWVGSNVGVATNTNGGGDHFLLTNGLGYCRNIPSSFNDRISSLDNHLGVPVHFWWDANCNGTRASYPAGVHTQNDVGWWHNDEFSSYCIGAWTESFCAYWE